MASRGVNKTIKNKYTIPNIYGKNYLQGNSKRFIVSQFWKLPIDKQKIVRTHAERYFTACGRLKIKPDPSFFKEVILDVRNDTFQCII